MFVVIYQGPNITCNQATMVKSITTTGLMGHTGKNYLSETDFIVFTYPTNNARKKIELFSDHIEPVLVQQGKNTLKSQIIFFPVSANFLFKLSQ